MKQLRTIFLFTLKTAAKRRSFIISTLLMIILVVGMSLVPYMQNLREARKETGVSTEGESVTSTVNTKDAKYTLYYVDAAGLIPDGVTALQNNLSDVGVVAGNASEMAHYQALVSRRSNVSLVYITEPEEGATPYVPNVHILNRNIVSGVSDSQIQDILSRSYISSLLSKQGVSSDVTDLLKITLPTTVTTTSRMDIAGYMVGFLVALFIFFTVYYYGYSVAVSIANDKSSHVMEILVSSAKPGTVLAAKVLAMGVLGIIQFLIVAVVLYLAYLFLIPSGYQILGMTFSLSSVTKERALIIFIYFLLGYSLYASMNGIVGAAVGRVEDLSASMMPILLIAIFSFLLSIVVAFGGLGNNDTLRTICSLVPFTSAFYMPFQVLSENSQPMDMILSMSIMVAFTVVLMMAAIRLYKLSLPGSSKRVRLRDLFRSRRA